MKGHLAPISEPGAIVRTGGGAKALIKTGAR